jgi:hypothetical protein
MIMGLRVAPEVEIEGLDLPEMGALAYPDFTLIPSHSGSGGISLGSALKPQPEFLASKKPQTA